MKMEKTCMRKLQVKEWMLKTTSNYQKLDSGMLFLVFRLSCLQLFALAVIAKLIVRKECLEGNRRKKSINKNLVVGYFHSLVPR